MQAAKGKHTKTSTPRNTNTKTATRATEKITSAATARPTSNQRAAPQAGATMAAAATSAAAAAAAAAASAARPQVALAVALVAVVALLDLRSGAQAAAAASNNGQIVTIATPAKVNFTDCGARNIKEVRITPCAGDGSVCHINLGTNVTVEADFVARHEAESLNEIIKGVIRGRELQFPEQRADPCRSTISPACPIKPGKHYQYKASFEVKPYYPAIPVKVRYALANPNGDIVACVQISAKIIDPSPLGRSAKAAAAGGGGGGAAGRSRSGGAAPKKKAAAPSSRR